MRYCGLLVLVLAASAGCDDEVQKMAGLVAPAPLASMGVRAYVVREPGGTEDRVTLTIYVDSKDVGVAAYQGRFEYDAGALEISEATTPSDGTRIVNTAAGPGQVRFAGFAAEGFAKTAAARLVVRPLKPLEQANFLVTLDVVGEASGAAVAKERMVPLRGIFTSKAAIQ